MLKLQNLLSVYKANCIPSFKISLISLKIPLFYSNYSRFFLQIGINFPLLGISFHLMEKYFILIRTWRRRARESPGRRFRIPMIILRLGGSSREWRKWTICRRELKFFHLTRKEEFLWVIMDHEAKTKPSIFSHKSSCGDALVEKSISFTQEQLDQDKTFPKLLRSPGGAWMLTDWRKRPWTGWEIKWKIRKITIRF